MKAQKGRPDLAMKIDEMSAIFSEPLTPLELLKRGDTVGGRVPVFMKLTNSPFSSDISEARLIRDLSAPAEIGRRSVS